MALEGLFLATALAASAVRCDALTQNAVEGGRIVAAEVLPADREHPAACRLQIELRPRAEARIGVELWLPLDGWSGRFVQLGTGGFAGTIPTVGLAAEVRRGNAAAATDTGHVGADGFDARWASGRPDLVADYGYRSLELSAVAAQSVTAAFYGDRPHHRYFVGCSNGGRQALMVAQRYPDLFDGILAGAPALRWSAQFASFAWTQHRLRATPGGLIPRAKLKLIQDAAVASCDPAAEVLDGVPGDPRACNFRPEALQCTAGDGHTCLTAAEVRSLRAIIDGAPSAFGYEPTSAAVPGGWDHWIVNPDRGAQTQLTFAEQVFGHMAQDRPGWRIEDFQDRDMETARALASVLDPAEADLSRFHAHGGRLVIYSGWADPVIAPYSAVDYYRRLAAHDHVRLFMIPGMLHCQGGEAPNAFGQAPIAPAAQPDAEHDIRRALEAWVEDGRSPESITAVKYVGDDPKRGVAAKRTIRAYPRR
jgi:feruloyl esterase